MSMHKIQGWVYQNFELSAGFLSGSVVTTSVATSILDFTVTAIQTITLALLSGAAGAFGAHLLKKYILKSPNKNENS